MEAGPADQVWSLEEFGGVGGSIGKATGGKGSVNRVHFTMTAVAFVWLSLALWLVFSGTTGRDVYTVGAIAKFLDKVPSVVSTPIFILLWIVFLLGWLVLLTLGLRPLVRRRSKP
jgi:hypothetical protein